MIYLKTSQFFIMSYSYSIEIGRIVFGNYGQQCGKIFCIVNIMDKIKSSFSITNLFDLIIIIDLNFEFQNNKYLWFDLYTIVNEKFNYK